MMSRIGLCAAAIAVAAVSGASSANALTATISWYEVYPASSDPSEYDFNTAPATECCSYYFDNEVGSTLSGGVPVVGAGNSAIFRAGRNGITVVDAERGGHLRGDHVCFVAARPEHVPAGRNGQQRQRVFPDRRGDLHPAVQFRGV